MKPIASLITAFTCVVLTAPAHLRAAAPAKDAILKQFNDSITAISKKTIPMVVNISAIKVTPKNRIQEYDQNGRPQREFPFQPPHDPRALGSGVIIDKRGYIITNHHVVKDTVSIKITLSDRREFNCSILGSDPATDIAVIKIDSKVPDDLPVIEMGDSDKIEVGELVIAIGNPFGFSHTVTTGIISATGRQSVGLTDYENFIQTDAAINPGNSGGALININGRLIGINTAIFSRSGGYMGIGFAIPVNMIKEILKELISTGRVTRGWLGVYIQELTRDIAELLKYPGKGGALVSDIMKGSPAEKTDIKKGDIITRVDGVDIKDINHLRRVVAARKPGTKVALNVYRNGKIMEISMVLGKLPDKPVVAATSPGGQTDYLGLAVRDIDEDMAFKYRTGDRKGVVITRVDRRSPGGQAGLAPGDVIKEVERTVVDSLKTYTDLIATLKSKKKILLLVARGGNHRFVVVDMAVR